MIVGEIRIFGAPPSDPAWLECDGAAVSRTTYASLFAVIALTYGIGDGSTTFNLPDFGGRSPMGHGSADGGPAWATGDRIGENTHVLSVTEMPGHTHTYDAPDTLMGITLGGLDNIPTAANPTATSEVGSGGSHNTIHPVQVVLMYIWSGP